MRFDDDYECVAVFISASQDFDGSLHVVYDKVEWSNDPRHLATTGNSAFHVPGEAVVSIEEMKAST
jgi:hypothetical protein